MAAKKLGRDIDLFLSMVSAAARQKEFFNNPVAEGEIFKDIIYGKVPALSKFKFLVIYGDPAPGENKTKKSSTKQRSCSENWPGSSMSSRGSSEGRRTPRSLNGTSNCWNS